MSETIRKKFSPWEFADEESWIIRQSKQGKQLVAAEKGLYSFEEGDGWDFEYRVHIMPYKSESPKGADYMGFIKTTTGVDILGVSGRTLYLRMNRDNRNAYFEDDTANRLKYLRRLNLPFVIIILAFFLAGFVMLWKGMTGGAELFKYISLPAFLAGLLFSTFYINIRAQIKEIKGFGRKRKRK